MSSRKDRKWFPPARSARNSRFGSRNFETGKKDHVIHLDNANVRKAAASTEETRWKPSQVHDSDLASVKVNGGAHPGFCIYRDNGSGVRNSLPARSRASESPNSNVAARPERSLKEFHAKGRHITEVRIDNTQKCFVAFSDKIFLSTSSENSTRKPERSEENKKTDFPASSRNASKRKSEPDLQSQCPTCRGSASAVADVKKDVQVSDPRVQYDLTGFDNLGKFSPSNQKNILRRQLLDLYSKVDEAKARCVELKREIRRDENNNFSSTTSRGSNTDEIAGLSTVPKQKWNKSDTKILETGSKKTEDPLIVHNRNPKNSEVQNEIKLPLKSPGNAVTNAFDAQGFSGDSNSAKKLCLDSSDSAVVNVPKKVKLCQKTAGYTRNTEYSCGSVITQSSSVAKAVASDTDHMHVGKTQREPFLSCHGEQSSVKGLFELNFPVVYQPSLQVPYQQFSFPLQPGFQEPCSLSVYIPSLDMSALCYPGFPVLKQESFSIQRY